MTTYEAVNFIREHVRIGHGGLEVWGVTIHTCAGLRKLHVSLVINKLTERETGTPIKVHHEHYASAIELVDWDPPRLMHWFRGVVIAFIKHEVDESIIVDGVRIFDPHLPEKVQIIIDEAREMDKQP